MLYDIRADAGAQPELAVLIATLLDGTRKWRAGLGRVSPQALVWQPYGLSPSIGGLILHMVDVEAYWLRQFAACEMEDLSKPEAEYNGRLEQYKHSWPAPPRKPLRWYYDLQDARRAEHLEYIRRQTDPGEAKGRASTKRRIVGSSLTSWSTTRTTGDKPCSCTRCSSGCARSIAECDVERNKEVDERHDHQDRDGPGLAPTLGDLPPGVDCDEEVHARDEQ